MGDTQYEDDQDRDDITLLDVVILATIVIIGIILYITVILLNKYFGAKTPYQGKKRSFGKFKCSSCRIKWTSYDSWPNKGENCRNCGSCIYPHKQEPSQHVCNTKKSSVIKSMLKHLKLCSNVVIGVILLGYITYIFYSLYLHVTYYTRVQIKVNDEYLAV